MIRAVIFDMFETLITHYETPLYFGREVAADLGIEDAALRPLWDGTETERTIGAMTIDEVVRRIMEENGCYSEELLQKVLQKRVDTKVDCFRHLKEGLIPMLEELKARGVKIAVLSNCYYEEARVIRESRLAPFFDVFCLSCELGMKKPDPAIFKVCLDELRLPAQECLYVGDGGDRELEVAGSLGMQTAQACWYLKEGTYQPCGILDGFTNAMQPGDILGLLDLS